MSYVFIGCTHFGHAKIIKLCNRPFSSIEEMDEKMIEMWNETVGPNDRVIHLGDFSFKARNADAYLKRLNGEIILIQGNHDRPGWGERYLEMKIDNRKICFFHHPIEEWDCWWHGSLHIHAHTHNPEFHSAIRRGNVSADAIGYRPLALPVAIERLLAAAEPKYRPSAQEA